MSKMFDPSQHGGEGMTDLPAGDYFVRIEDTELKKAQTGSYYIEIKLRVIYGDFEGTPFWDSLSTLEQALWKLGDLCQSVQQNTIFDIESNNAIKSALKGRIGKCRTKTEEYEGQKRARVAKWLLPSEEERAWMNQQAGPSQNTNPNVPPGAPSSAPAGGPPQQRDMGKIPF